MIVNIDVRRGTVGRMDVDCCSPVLTAPLGETEAEQLAGLLKILGDPTRLRLLSLIANCPDSTACACDLVDVLDRSQPTISHHLKVLYEAGLLERWREGTWIHYRVRPEALSPLQRALAPTALVT
jgi:ArsR family transcriptional regulator